MPVKSVPDGFTTVTPYIMSADPDGLMKFLKEAFGGKEVHVMRGEDGRLVHGQVRVVDSIVMIGGANSQWPPEKCSLYLYLEDSDKAFNAAIAAGAQMVMPVSDQIYGDRMGGVKDPTGNTWWLATHVEDVSEEEMARRFEERASRG